MAWRGVAWRALAHDTTRHDTTRSGLPYFTTQSQSAALSPLLFSPCPLVSSVRFPFRSVLPSPHMPMLPMPGSALRYMPRALKTKTKHKNPTILPCLENPYSFPCLSAFCAPFLSLLLLSSPSCFRTASSQSHRTRLYQPRIRGGKKKSMPFHFSPITSACTPSVLVCFGYVRAIVRCTCRCCPSRLTVLVKGCLRARAAMPYPGEKRLHSRVCPHIHVGCQTESLASPVKHEPGPGRLARSLGHANDRRADDFDGKMVEL